MPNFLVWFGIYLPNYVYYECALLVTENSQEKQPVKDGINLQGKNV